MIESTAAERVFAEQVRLLYRLSRPAYVASLVNSSILVFALWGVVPSAWLGAWLCAMFIVTGARFLLYRAFRGLRPADAAAPRWASRFAVGAGAAGVLWGLAGSALYPASSLPHQFLVIFLIGGMTMVAMVILAPVRRAFYAFVLPALIPVCATVLMQGTVVQLFMGAMMIIYFLLMLATVPIMAGIVRDVLQGKFDNAMLVERLSETNRELSARMAAQERAEAVLRESEARYRQLFEANPVPMWIRDQRTLDILVVNEAALRCYGYSREEFLRLKTADLVAEDDLPRYLDIMRQRAPGDPGSGHWRHRRRDGVVIEVETVSYACELNGQAARLTMVREVTERRRAERRLQMGHAITRILADARTVEEAMPLALRTICESGGWVYGQRWALDLAANRLHCAEVWHEPESGLDQFEAFNRARTPVFGGGGGPIHRTWGSNGPVWVVDLTEERQMMRGALALKLGLRSSFSFPILIGDTFYGMLEFFAREPSPVDPALMESVRTIGSQLGQFMARKTAEQNLRFVASHDPLTGLFNRTMFGERLQQALAQAVRFERRLALLFVDLDGFKHVNDTLGHNVGDALLAELATRLRATLREGDVIGRMGGDEFVVLIEEIEEATQAAEVAKKVLEAAARPFALQGQECRVSASVGIGIYPDDGRDAQTLLKNADIAMYRVKQQGRNSFRFYSPQMNVHLLERLSLESGLRGALERGELLLLYQPRVGVADGRITGFEALMRWRHPTQGLISPSEFVPVAEDAGLIHAIGEWALREACRQAAGWRAGLRVGVNLSHRQFQQDGLIQILREALHQARLEPQRLELEITEEMVMRDPERAGRLLDQVKALGSRVVIDDFGTGYSSLGFLRRLPVDSVKIDRSLVLDLPHNEDAAALARGVLAMAHSLGITVTAEGVETREQWEFLRRLECEEMQGNYFSAPVGADRVAALLQEAPVAGRRATVQALHPRRGEGLDPPP